MTYILLAIRTLSLTAPKSTVARDRDKCIPKVSHPPLPLIFQTTNTNLTNNTKKYSYFYVDDELLLFGGTSESELSRFLKTIATFAIAKQSCIRLSSTKRIRSIRAITAFLVGLRQISCSKRINYTRDLR